MPDPPVLKGELKMKKVVSRGFIASVIYRWTWFLLLSRIPLTQAGLGKIWSSCLELFQLYLSSFGPDTFTKISSAAQIIWSFLLFPSLGLILVVVFVRMLKKHIPSKKSNPDSPTLLQQSKEKFGGLFSHRDYSGSVADTTAGETYYFVRFVSQDDYDELCEQLIDVTDLKDRPKTFDFRMGRFKLLFHNQYDKKVPLIYLEGTDVNGRSILEEPSVLLPLNTVYSLPLHASFELISITT